MRAINRLSARTVAAAKESGLYPDGGGLYLKVTPSGTRSWVMRYTRAGKTTDRGLGSVMDVSLLRARERRTECRAALSEGLEAPRYGFQPVQHCATWGECVDAFLAAQAPGWRSPKQLTQWQSSLLAYGPARDIPVDHIDTPAVLGCLMPIWTTKTETATRVRGRIERVLDWARVSGHRASDNPARWRGHLDKLLAKPSKVAKVEHFAAMPYSDVPRFMRALARRPSLSARALQFTILTAARAGETIGASWDEFEDDVWRIPGARMKAGAEHTVPIVPAAAVLVGERSLAPGPFALSTAAMLMLIRGMDEPYTVHGFRSAFRDWAAETTSFSAEVVEMALAHTIRNKTEAAYRRGTLLAKRRELMQAWADFCAGG